MSMSSPPAPPPPVSPTMSSPGWPAVLPPFVQKKMDEYFREWLALPETEESIFALVDDAKAGRPLTWRHPYSKSRVSPLRQTTFGLMTPPPRSPGGLSPRSGALPSILPIRSPTSRPVKMRPITPMRGPGYKPTKRKQREVVPLFYFPNGVPQPTKIQEEEEERIRDVFAKSISEKPVVTEDEFAELIEIMGLPGYFRRPLFDKLLASAGHGHGNKESGADVDLDLDIDDANVISESFFLNWWDQYMRKCDLVVRFFNILRTPPNNYITSEDFAPVLDTLLDEHSALEFLKATPEFQERYAETVIVRIFYKVNRSQTGRITLRELRNSDLVDTMCVLDNEPDINRVTEYFSYEHFYVLYCRFFELDSDHDMLIDKYDLLRYSDHSLTYRIAERIFDGAPRPLHGPDGRMTYHDFVWFCLSEEDKSTDVALQYWFRCVDIDGDGAISSYEMEYFYTEQLRRMESLAIEAVAFEDVLCQLLDMAKPQDPKKITLADVKRSQLGANFFNMLFNLTKFIRQESRDAAAIRNERMKSGMTEWDRFARIEYDLLAAEESGEMMADDMQEEEELSDGDDYVSDIVDVGHLGPQRGRARVNLEELFSKP